MQVHSTLHRGLVELVPATPGEIGIYVCGATVQSEPHVGHGRYAVVFDMVRRYLTWRGNRVVFVRNITDIDDKIIVAAAAAGETVPARAIRIAELFTRAYRALGVLEPDIEPKATQHIPDMIVLIRGLIDRGLAYPAANGDVYFSVRADAGYGKLSGRRLDDLRAGARIDISEEKQDPLDFALWKAAKPGEPWWDSPWGPGRPGWHIECSAMAARYLGADFAIHGGGTDLIFPHHENEIAQSEGATGTTFARYWLHNGMLNLAGEKMSKSTGRLIDLAAAVERFGGMGLRLFYLRAHYRSPLDYTEELVDAAVVAYDRLVRFLKRAPQVDGAAGDTVVMGRFVAAMDEDFGTPQALAVAFEVLAEANRLLDAGADAAGLVNAVHEIARVLGIGAEESSVSDLGVEIETIAVELGVAAGEPVASLEALVSLRAAARAQRDFHRSDLVRDRLSAIGIVLEDGAHGTRWIRR